MNPFIPIKSANLAIVDGRISREIEENLIRLGLKIIKTIKCNNVDESISYHPDIVIHPINHKTLVIAPSVFDYYKLALKDFDVKVIKGEKRLGREYPDDIAYNIGRIGNLAIHNFKHTDSLTKYYLSKENLEFVDIKQGYSKCSLAVLGEKAAMTSDYGIYNKLSDLGYNILLIQAGYIGLQGQTYGFIGGTNGNISKDKTVFSGSFNNHPNRDAIVRFMEKNKIDFEILSKERITDIGTIIALNV